MAPLAPPLPTPMSDYRLAFVYKLVTSDLTKLSYNLALKMKLPSLRSRNIVLCLLVIGHGRLVVNSVGRERYSKLKVLIIKLGGRLVPA